MYHPRRAWEMQVLIDFWVWVSESVNARYLGWTSLVSLLCDTVGITSIKHLHHSLFAHVTCTISFLVFLVCCIRRREDTTCVYCLRCCGLFDVSYTASRSSYGTGPLGVCDMVVVGDTRSPAASPFRLATSTIFPILYHQFDLSRHSSFVCSSTHRQRHHICMASASYDVCQLCEHDFRIVCASYCCMRGDFRVCHLCGHVVVVPTLNLCSPVRTCPSFDFRVSVLLYTVPSERDEIGQGKVEWKREVEWKTIGLDRAG